MPPTSIRPKAPTPKEALHLLIEGNDRYIQQRTKTPRRDRERMIEVSHAQTPFAAIVGCSDSRVIPEVLFDQGIGDLFVVRIAGNTVIGGGSGVKGSIEYAIEHLHVPLILVLGHESCGAVDAALKFHDGLLDTTEHIESLAESIQPAIVAAKKRTDGKLLDRAIEENVLLGVQTLVHLNPYIEDKLAKGTVQIVGATYDIDEGHIQVVC